MRYKLHSLKLSFINRTAVFVTLAVLLILATFAYGAVVKHRTDVAQAKAVAAQHAADKARADAAVEASKAMQADYNALKVRQVTACSVLAQYATAPKTKALVQVPAVCKQ